MSPPLPTYVYVFSVSALVWLQAERFDPASPDRWVQYGFLAVSMIGLAHVVERWLNTEKFRKPDESRRRWGGRLALNMLLVFPPFILAFVFGGIALLWPVLEPGMWGSN